VPSNEKSRNVLVVGVFDLFHVGHIRLLKRAKELGDRLIVAVNSDKVVASYKRVPVIDQTARAEIVAACRYVDETVIAHSFEVAPLLSSFAIATIVHGNEWERSSYLKQIRLTEADLVRFGVDLAFLPYTSGVSTSDIIETIECLRGQRLLASS
jgi:cytidyltransferase-like protein